MEKIIKYVTRFFTSQKINTAYDMKVGEWAELIDSKQNRCDQ